MRQRGRQSSSAATDTSPLLIGIVAPFTGADAALGPAYFAACLPAARAINNGGGIMGHTVSCQQFDTRGEPADAVPAAQQMVASHSNLMAVVGCTSDEASSVVPIIDHAHIPMFCMTGQSEFNKSNFSYFHRLVPPDAFDSYALVGSALDYAHYTKVALVFGNDIGSQAFVGPAQRALTALGATVTINQSIALGQSSYRTEVTAMLATHPDVIFTEALGPTDATYLAEVKQLNGSTLPFMGTSATIDPVWFSAVTGAIGVQDVLNKFTAVDLGVSFSGPGYTEFKTNLGGLGLAIRRRSQVLAARRDAASLRRHHPGRAGHGRDQEHRPHRLQRQDQGRRQRRQRRGDGEHLQGRRRGHQQRQVGALGGRRRPDQLRPVQQLPAGLHHRQVRRPGERGDHRPPDAGSRPPQ